MSSHLSVNFHYLELKRAEEQPYIVFVQFVKDCEGRSNLFYTVIYCYLYSHSTKCNSIIYSKHLSMSLMSRGPISNPNPKQT